VLQDNGSLWLTHTSKTMSAINTIESSIPVARVVNS